METILEDDLIPENSVNKQPLETLSDYLQEYNRMDQQIVALEIQINILEKSAQRYDTSGFDSSLHRLQHELYLRKEEIEPVVLIISQAISRLVPNGNGELIYEHFFLGHGVQEIARQHGVSDNYVTRSINAFLKTSIPNELVSEYGKVFTG